MEQPNKKDMQMTDKPKPTEAEEAKPKVNPIPPRPEPVWDGGQLVNWVEVNIWDAKYGVK